MLSKIIRPDSFGFDEPIAKLMEVHSKGVDKGWMMKRAAMFDDVIRDIKPEKGHTLIHVITTGAMETYGPNSNCDGFNKHAGEYRLPAPKKGQPEVIILGGGLDEYHKTYRKTGHVYKNHKDNKDPDKASGSIVHECVNDDMDRGELIISVDNDKWHDEIENLAEGKPIMLSQGSGVPYDICSYCGHRRTRFPDACEHIKRNKLAITSDGHQIFVINDKPNFHDISGVFKPADKMAFALRKVASGEVITSGELAEMEGYTAPTSLADHLYGKVYDKYAKLVKLAGMEKEILALGHDPSAGAFCDESGFKSVPNGVGEIISGDTNRSMGVMHGAKIVLPLELFIKLLLKNRPEASDVESILPAVRDRMPTLFSDMLDDGDVSETLKDGTYDGCPGLHQHIRPIIERMMGSHSLGFGPVKRRVSITVLNGRPGEPLKGFTINKRGAEENDAADFVAREYGKYLISFNRVCDDDFAERMSVVQKFV